MVDPEDEITPTFEEELALAYLTEEISSRLESGERVHGTDLGDNPETAGTIRQLLPGPRTMVSLGERKAHEVASRSRLQKKREGTPRSYFDANLEDEDVVP